MVLIDSMQQAVDLMVTANPDFVGAVKVSLGVAGSSTLLAVLVGIPLGFFLGLRVFPGHRLVTVIIQTLMAMPTVVVGLLVYAFLSRAGPMGGWGLLFTPAAMIIGQFVLAVPITTGLTMAATAGLDPRIRETALTLGSGRLRMGWTLFREAENAYAAAIMTAFGRVFAEVGVSMMLGGNIRFYTRSMTTAIALESGKGELALGLALGFILLLAALMVNVAVQCLRRCNGA